MLSDDARTSPGSHLTPCLLAEHSADFECIEIADVRERHPGTQGRELLVKRQLFVSIEGVMKRHDGAKPFFQEMLSLLWQRVTDTQQSRRTQCPAVLYAAPCCSRMAR
jgi:hypothetical protein